MQITVRNPERLPPHVRQEFDHLIASLQAWSDENHNADGTHSDIAASGDLAVAGTATFLGQPRCRLFKHDGHQAVADSANTLVTWTQPTVPQGNVSEEYNIGEMFDTSLSTTNVRIREEGLYHIEANVTFATSATGDRFVSLQYNNDEVALAQGAGATRRYQVSLVLWLRVNDMLNVEVAQTSGGSLDVLESAGTWFSVHKIG